ncbi:PREDICTED: uncharacterized protein LOC108374191 [Rhagoletis zephyria]|uniref:uncharacterized protein LOC108374191 n=1 Tax=Rhagoletis zephyria TaxID=28612 RepID=UPI0008115237|nr:PREDICTED: uncharacterized protein LOC108374191 [Rhagoletis zephyria]
MKPSPICQSDSIWVKGPDFLYSDEDMWPKEPLHLYSDHCAKEESKKCMLVTANKAVHIIEVHKFSSYLRLLRVTAWVKRFVGNLQDKQHQRGELTAKELNKADIYICRQVQLEIYHEEISILQNKKCLPKSSALYQLTPKLDEDGVLRINGRIDAAYCLPYTARHPIILPSSHYLTTLVMDHFHRKRHHHNDQLTINEMRQHFWIPRSRCLLKAVKRKCPVCIRSSVKPVMPLMGQLPPDHLTPYVRPFSYAGVDYCGPFCVAIGRRREKRWVTLFTCLTTRAVHIEVAEDLSTEAFIICLRNFVNRRGVPVRLRSDNGKNFIGAQHALERDQQLFDFDVIQQEAAKERIEWVFNCPAHPASGGCWDRLV